MDEKLDINDLDSVSSTSSEGIHFEIKEARKRNKKQDRNTKYSEALGVDAAIEAPGTDHEVLEKNKELDMKL